MKFGYKRPSNLEEKSFEIVDGKTDGRTTEPAYTICSP